MPHAGRFKVGAPVPLTGRYAAQGAQMLSGLKLWAARRGGALDVEDDASNPSRAASMFHQLLARRCDIVLGPYASDSTRAVAAAHPGTLIWNHGGAANDVQGMPGVVSIPSPSSEYLVALAQATTMLRPGAAVAVVTAAGAFARYARKGLEEQAGRLELTLLGGFDFAEAATALLGRRPEAVLAVGPLQKEIALFRQLHKMLPDALLGGVSPGLARFPELLGGDAENLIGVLQWHRDLGQSPVLGPDSADVLRDARVNQMPELDYVAAQVYAAALIATRCLELEPRDPLAAARRLRTTTFFGAFELDPGTGIQRGHRLSVGRWHRQRLELLRAEIS